MARLAFIISTTWLSIGAVTLFALLSLSDAQAQGGARQQCLRACYQQGEACTQRLRQGQGSIGRCNTQQSRCIEKCNQRRSG